MSHSTSRLSMALSTAIATLAGLAVAGLLVAAGAPALLELVDDTSTMNRLARPPNGAERARGEFWGLGHLGAANTDAPALCKGRHQGQVLPSGRLRTDWEGTLNNAAFFETRAGERFLIAGPVTLREKGGISLAPANALGEDWRKRDASIPSGGAFYAYCLQPSESVFVDGCALREMDSFSLQACPHRPLEIGKSGFEQHKLDLEAAWLGARLSMIGFAVQLLLYLALARVSAAAPRVPEPSAARNKREFIAICASIAGILGFFVGLWFFGWRAVAYVVALGPAISGTFLVHQARNTLRTHAAARATLDANAPVSAKDDDASPMELTMPEGGDYRTAAVRRPLDIPPPVPTPRDWREASLERALNAIQGGAVTVVMATTAVVGYLALR